MFFLSPYLLTTFQSICRTTWYIYFHLLAGNYAKKFKIDAHTVLNERLGKQYLLKGRAATHFEIITHFEICFFKCVKFGTKSMHFEQKILSTLQRYIIIFFLSRQFMHFEKKYVKHKFWN